MYMFLSLKVLPPQNQVQSLTNIEKRLNSENDYKQKISASNSIVFATGEIPLPWTKIKFSITFSSSSAYKRCISNHFTSGFPGLLLWDVRGMFSLSVSLYGWCGKKLSESRRKLRTTDISTCYVSSRLGQQRSNNLWSNHPLLWCLSKGTCTLLQNMGSFALKNDPFKSPALTKCVRRAK